MLRSLIIYLSKAEWMRQRVMRWKIARKVVLRFVAGEKLSEAIKIIKELNSESIFATLDQLGEDTKNAEQARQTAEDIILILNAISEAEINSSLSLKLSQIGLLLDETICEENLSLILSRAQELGIFVRIDMEDSPCVDATMRVYWKMRKEHGFDNVGMVIQSYLYRSEKDTEELLAGDTRIRLVKGAYKEPEEVAYPSKRDVDNAFDRLTKMMLDHAKQESSPAVSDDGRWPPITAVASHDEDRINYAISYAQTNGIPKEKLEFQMLYGIRRGLQKELVQKGYPVRVYVPFGSEWYPYFMRRLAERPANLWFFISSLFKG